MTEVLPEVIPDEDTKTFEQLIEELQWEIDMDELSEESVQCTVKRWTCYRCGFHMETCKDEAEWITIRECGCRMPICDKDKVRYVNHFDSCAQPNLTAWERDHYRCFWCKKRVRPEGFKHLKI